MFNEENTVERLVLDTLSGADWRFMAADDVPRQHGDVLVESMVREALIRLNPEIRQQPDRADEVLHRLRALPLSVQGEGLVRTNELFAAWLRGEKSMPFGENGEHTPVRLLDFDNLANNEYVISSQWVYPVREGGRRFDIVLLINGIPLVIGESKSPVRPAVSWLDGASDIHNGYEQRCPTSFPSPRKASAIVTVPYVCPSACGGRGMKGTTGAKAALPMCNALCAPCFARG